MILHPDKGDCAAKERLCISILQATTVLLLVIFPSFEWSHIGTWVSLGDDNYLMLKNII